MGSKDPKPEPSLELPSLGLGRRRKRGRAEATPEPEATPVVEPEVEPAVSETEDTQVVEPTPEADAAAPETTRVIETEPATEPQPAADERPAAVTAPKRRRARPRRLRGATATATLDPVERDSGHPAEPTGDAPEPPVKKERTLPSIPGIAAALVSGVVVGVLAVLLTGLSLRLCELVKGTPSCGGPGLFLLVAILILLTYVGGWLLRAWRIVDPMSTSFLAVGLLAVIAMLFFIDVLYSPWMLLVVPTVAAATYALSWWVTSTFVDVEESPDAGPVS